MSSAATLADANAQSFQSVSTTPQTPTGPRLNALKHGFYSEQILLPGDNDQEFARRRLAFFHRHRPQTEDEAECIEIMAESRWQWMRGRTSQAQFDAETRAPATDDTGRLSEPVAHQRFHTTMDGTVHRQRLQRMWYRAESRLRLLQRERRLGLIEGAVKLPAGCYMDSSGEIIGPVLVPVIVPRAELQLETPTVEANPTPKPAPVAAAVQVEEWVLAPVVEHVGAAVVETDNLAASNLADRRIGNFTEQKETGKAEVPVSTISPHTPAPGADTSGAATPCTPVRLFLRLADTPGEMTVRHITRPTQTGDVPTAVPTGAPTDPSCGTLASEMYADGEVEDAAWVGGTVARFPLRPSGLVGGLAGGLAPTTQIATQVGSGW